MTSKKLLPLLLAAILALGAGLWLAGRQSSTVGNARNMLYPQLQQQLDTVSSVRLFTAGADEVPAVTLQRQDAPAGAAAETAAGLDDASTSSPRWSVEQRHGYPLDAVKLRKLLLAIADARIIEEKTSDPKRYGTLGLAGLDAGDADGVRIQLSPVEVNLLVGKRAAAGQSNYVRRAGEPQALLIDTAIEVPAKPEDWLLKELLDIPAQRIQSIAVTLQGARTYTAAKAVREADDFRIEGLPPGRRLDSPSAMNSLAAALADLQLQDVQPADAFAAGVAEGRAQFRTFDGLIVDLQGWQRHDGHHISVQISFDPQQAARFLVPASTSGASRSTAEDDKPEDDKAARQARSLQARFAGWVYRIADYKYRAIFKPVKELLAAQ